MNKKQRSLFFLITSALIFSGCTFFSEQKRIELDFSDEKKEESFIEEDKISAENDRTDNSENIQAVPPNENLEKKIAEVAKEEKVEKKEVPTPLKISDNLINWGFAKSEGRKIDTVIIHSSYNSLGGDEHSLDKVLEIYKSYGVAPHYIIDRAGKIYRLVKDENIAYHAGVSNVPDGRENVNNFSIGIEIINTKSESPNGAQYAALKKLLSYLKDEYEIKYVLGHSDIAPGRKDDPWNFDWDKVE